MIEFLWNVHNLIKGLSFIPRMAVQGSEVRRQAFFRPLQCSRWRLTLIIIRAQAHAMEPRRFLLAAIACVTASHIQSKAGQGPP